MYKNVLLLLTINSLFHDGISFNYYNHSILSNLNFFHKTKSNVETKEYDFIKLVNRHNYTAEEYIIESKDGYNLCLHRISGSPAYPKAAGKKVVYIQHGLAMWSINFVLIGPGKDLAFLLSDAGYDVWLGNVRGTPLSRSHKSKFPENKDFWDFSYHEVALNDVSSFIDKALNITKQKKLTYIGYSMGSTEGFALFSMLPEYNKKINLFIGLAPVSLWKHNTGLLIHSFASLFNTIQVFHRFTNFDEIFSREKNSFGLCNLRYLRERIFCSRLFSLIDLTFNSNQIEESAFAMYADTFPVGTSAKTLFHLAQNIKSGEFRLYDYGRSANKVLYGTEGPPKYPLGKISVPTALLYGPKDIFATEKDVENLKKALPNVIICKKTSHAGFGHLEMILGNDANSHVFKDILDLVAKQIW